MKKHTLTFTNDELICIILSIKESEKNCDILDTTDDINTWSVEGRAIYKKIDKVVIRNNH